MARTPRGHGGPRPFSLTTRPRSRLPTVPTPRRQPGRQPGPQPELTRGEVAQFERARDEALALLALCAKGGKVYAIQPKGGAVADVNRTGRRLVTAIEKVLADYPRADGIAGKPQPGRRP
jgi:hypothetical protein